MKSFTAHVSKFAVAAALLCAAGASQAEVVISSIATQGFVTTSNFGRANALTTAPWNVNDNGTSLLAFCIDPTVGLSTSLTTYTGSTFTGFDNNESVQRLYSLYYPTLVKDGALDKAPAMSFQLALWELYNDNGSLTDGKLAIKAIMNPSADAKAEIKQAADMLTAATNSATAIANHYNFTAYRADGSQTVVNASLKLAATDVPEPASLAMFGLGAALMGAVARRRSRA